MALSKKMLAIVAVIVLVLVVIIAAAAMNGGNTKASDNGSNDTNNNTDNANTNTQTPTRTAENANMKATVSDVLIGTNETALNTETYLPLDAGEHYVTVMFNVTSKLSTDGSAPALWWQLDTSDGQVNTVTVNAKNVYPDGIQPGATAQYVLVYAIADGATPTKLVYGGMTTLEISLT